MKTLLVLATHFIDENIISEFRKIKNTPNVDAVLAIDNTNPKIEFQSRVENKIFFDTTCKCFFFDSKLNDEMQLPQFTYFKNWIYKNFGDIMWNNSDYRFYYLKKFFPNYDYYWLLDYDVFCNAENYAGFLEKFSDNTADLLINKLRTEENNGKWEWCHHLKWIYKTPEIYAGFFAVVRLSARAIDFLYKKRLEHKKIFQNTAENLKRWPGSEAFVPTELMNAGFVCENLNAEHLNYKPDIYLNDERIFLNPDDNLYHPVKSVKTEISKMQAQYDNLFLLYQKVFFNSLAEKLVEISIMKNLSMHFDKNFNYVVLALPSMGGINLALRYEARFMQGKIFVSLAFEGEYEKYFEILNQCSGLNQLQPLQMMKTAEGKVLSHVVPTLDNVSNVATAMKILIESTYHILQEKFL